MISVIEKEAHDLGQHTACQFSQCNEEFGKYAWLPIIFIDIGIVGFWIWTSRMKGIIIVAIIFNSLEIPNL